MEYRKMKVGLIKRSHHFVVTGVTSEIRPIINKYLNKLTQFQTKTLPNGETVSVKYKVFADANVGLTDYRFHIETYSQVRRYLEDSGVTISEEEEELYTPVKVEFPLNPKFEPRDYQVPIIDNIVEDGYKKVITLQTGRGKTAVLLFAMKQLGLRTALVIKPKYFERWLGDVTDTNPDSMIPLKPGKDVITIQGSSELVSLINMAKAGEITQKLIVISSPTLFAFLSEFRVTGRNERYGNIEPQELWGLLGIGLLGVDEGHEHFHANYKLDLYTHAPKTVTLSATLVPDDKFLKAMYEILYPPRLRMDAGEYVCYADVLYVPYSLTTIDNIKTSWRGRRDYSQLAYENSILEARNSDRLQNMVNMLCHDIDTLFLPTRMPKHKLLVFFDTVEMCCVVSQILADRYPDLSVGKYTAEESYEVLSELDIIVATTKSADTGVDIPKLQMCLCFVARGSTQSNLQMFGRLRALKDKTHRPTFVYYFCTDIPQHFKYHLNRMEIFRNKTVSLLPRYTHFQI